jgi:hypothetical protein
MNNKRASIGEWINTIYRMVIVSFLALIILGSSQIFYSYHVDVRQSEAIIMSRNIMDCMSPKGIIDLEEVKKNQEDFGLLESCISSGKTQDRFFIRASFKDGSGDEIEKLQEGDSGALWVRELFLKVSGDASGAVKRQRPGYWKQTFSSTIKKDDLNIKGRVELEVLVRNE